MENVMVANRSLAAAERTKLLSVSDYPMLFWLFMTGSVFGFVLEGLWMMVTAGYWESHSAVIWGPFCTIYGIGAVMVFLVSQLFSDRHALLQFGACFLSGSLVEYFTSLFQELCFGSSSWDYSGHFLNIGGRVSLQMALAWGILGVLFMRFLFPSLKRLLIRLNGRKGALLCGIMTVFMLLNLAATSVVLVRWRERQEHIPPSNGIVRTIDSLYGDEKVERMFPNMRFISG